MHVPRALALAGAALVAATAVATTAALMTITIFTAVGDGSQGFGGDGGQAVAAKLSLPTGIALTADSGVVIADSGNARVRNVSSGGVITTIAGTGTIGFAGDGGAATAAQISAPGGIAVLADGAVVIADTGNDRIRVVSTGIISTIAGGGPPGVDLGDGLPATAATLKAPGGVAATPDGGFLIADTADARIRKVGPDGIISTVAGSGQSGFAGDGGPAIAAQLTTPGGVAPTADGGFLIADSGNNRIRKVSPAGTITTVAGVGTAGFSGDGGNAVAAQLSDPLGVTPIPNGGFFIADTFNDRVRFVDVDGTISTAAGGAPQLGDRGLPTRARLSHPSGVTLTDDGYLIADQMDNRIRRVSPVPAQLVVRISLPSRCVRAGFSARISTASTYLVTSLTVRLDGRSLASRGVVMGVRIKTAALRRGRHVLRADAIDITGKKASITRRFTVCRS